ncbi:hypothetical protein ACFXPZ_16095 [Streptomyces sp. NPDC059101]|uniref:hypothetical protein n=1 Tax=Streptomyces sp. NPDC059101 TaxID=3346728 RepID=UPI0036B286DE
MRGRWFRTPQGDWAVEDPRTGLTRYFSEAAHAPGLALLDEVADRNGNYLSFDYDDETGAPLAIRHSGGHHLRFTCDERGLVTALYLAGGAEDGGDALVVSYGHDDMGNLTAVTTSCGIPGRYEYDALHRMTAWVDTNASRYEYTYDASGRCVSQGGTEGHLRYHYAYGRTDPETGHRTTTATNSLGRTSHYRINERLQVVAETDPLGNTSRKQWDSRDQLLSATDASGNVTRYAWDDDHNLAAVQLPDGSVQTITCNAFHLPVEITGAHGAVWRQEWDDKGNRTAVTTPDGARSTSAYEGTGAVTAVADPTGATRHFVNDAAGLPTAVRDPLGNTTSVVRDAFGHVTQLTDPTGAVKYIVSSAPRTTSSRSPPPGTSAVGPPTRRWPRRPTPSARAPTATAPTATSPPSSTS